MMDEPLLLGILFIIFLLFIALSIAMVMSYLYYSQKSQFDKRLHEEYKKLVESVNQQSREQLEQMRKQDLAGLQQWREQELEISRKQQYETAKTEITSKFNEWKLGFEKAIRQDAIQRSQAVTVGKVTEHIVPYLPEFPFNPKDARFIGSPIDFIVFDGLNEDKVIEVVFIEIKTGVSSLSTRERQVRNAIKEGKVSWMEIRPTLNQSSGLEGEECEAVLESTIMEPT